MRGRATSVALPALVVLVLVAVVAVAATGSVSRGSSATRAPSTTLLDALFTLSLLAVVAGAILLVYGLFQRKEIARQMASGRYPRFTLVGFLAFVVLVTAVVSLFKRPWDLSNANEEGVLYGSVLEKDISKSLKAAGFAVESDHVKLEGAIKALGMYTVRLEFHPEVSTEVKIWVVPAATR